MDANVVPAAPKKYIEKDSALTGWIWLLLNETCLHSTFTRLMSDLSLWCC
jgi:hypothetical protein